MSAPRLSTGGGDLPPEPLHVLCIPSEEFVPARSHLEGIAQLHQLQALAASGTRVGALSIRQSYSLPMIVRASLARLMRRQPKGALGALPLAGLVRLAFEKSFRPRLFVTHDEVDRIPVVRVDGFFYGPPWPATSHVGWLKAGMAAYTAYEERHGRPDLLHAHNLHPAGMLARRISRRTGIPYVLTEHSSAHHYGQIPATVRPVLRRVLRDAAGVAVVSPALGRVLSERYRLGGLQPVHLPNVIDPALMGCTSPIARPERAVARDDDRFVLLAVGNLLPVKNHAMLLRALAHPLLAMRRLVVRIGGQGPLLNELQAQAASLGVSDRVDFLGLLSREEVAAQLDGCHALVLSSDYETFGVVLIEAMIRGRPVIATACGGPDSIVTSESGLLVSPGDGTGLARAIATLMDEYRRFDGETIRANALQRFGPARFARDAHRFYETVLANV